MGRSARDVSDRVADAAGDQNLAEDTAGAGDKDHHGDGRQRNNATEGFGIVAPLAAEGERPSWATLLLLGLIGGGPTFLGTVVSQHIVNDTVSIAFLGLAAGSILHVVIELLAVARRPH
ncbi:hypothetical protein [Streptomyces sp. NPDC059010]|uniref:hypothetical protein n=1 Tax=Streptomyces sp. NPDC059010 TaxID=3346695 RepID=UPI0036AE1B71